MVFSSVQYYPLFFEKFVDFAQVVHVYDFVLATAGRVGESAKPNARQRASRRGVAPRIPGVKRRAEDRPRRKTPVNGRRRTTLCRRSSRQKPAMGKSTDGRSARRGHSS